MTAQPQQLTLLDDPGTVSYLCACQEQPDGTWRATLYGGWYVATGATITEAAQKCVDAYLRETEMMR